jgi:hypothetical protein
LRRKSDAREGRSQRGFLGATKIVLEVHELVEARDVRQVVARHRLNQLVELRARQAGDASAVMRAP